MRFRPCIDIHNGQVKQIVGGSLADKGDFARENFTSGETADFYAGLYKKDGLKGGHVILLNGKDSPYFKKTKEQAFAALKAYPGGLQAGGGVTAENAQEYLNAGASHVIVTSYVFRDGKIQYQNLEKLVREAGKGRVVLDVSCRKRDGAYWIVTDRWQKFTDVSLTEAVLDELAGYCDEFLVHGVDVEGKKSGVEKELVKLLAAWKKLPVTYAGGIGSMEELEEFVSLSRGKLDFTIGSALDLFGGTIPYERMVRSL